jgi:hypothetical protein
MGAFLSACLRRARVSAIVLGLSVSAVAAEIQEGQTLWVKAGTSIELEAMNKQIFDAPAGTSLLVQKISRVKGRNGSFIVATVQDAVGNTYRTLAANLWGKVTADAVQSAVDAPANAESATRVLSGQEQACAPADPPTYPPGDSTILGSAVRTDPPEEEAAEEQPAVSAKSCVSTKKHPSCKKTPCNLEAPDDSAMRKFYPMIVEALNGANVSAANARARARGIAEIHPAMIASIIAAESSGDPLVTFTEKSGRKGKGIGQYTYFQKAWGANLDYNAPKPSEASVFGTKVNTPYRLTHAGTTKQVYSVWSPKGVILGMAGDLTKILAEDRYITPRGKAGAPIPGAVPIEVSTIYKTDPTQAMRYLAGHHNRQDLVFQSIEEHYRQKGRLPSEYGENWGVTPIKGTPKKLLYGQCINRCYVEKIAGLCGGASGFFARYWNDFVQSTDGTWSVAG